MDPSCFYCRIARVACGTKLKQLFFTSSSSPSPEHAGDVRARGGVQGDPIRALLLPRRHLRAAQVRRAGLEPIVPVQHGRPDDLHRRALQLPGGEHEGAVGGPALPVRRDHVRRPHHRRLGPQAVPHLPAGVHGARNGASAPSVLV